MTDSLDVFETQEEPQPFVEEGYLNDKLN